MTGRNLKVKTVVKDNPPKKICSHCGKSKHLIKSFYASDNPIDAEGRINMCKDCIKDIIDYEDIDTVKSVLNQINKPFIADKWDAALEEIKNPRAKNKDPFGCYMKIIYLNYNGQVLTWKDSDFTKSNEQQFTETINQTTDTNAIAELMDKWGEYPADEIVLFEKKYQQLRVNYPERTAMHIEALQIYVRYRVKEELATQKGLFKEAEGWGKLAKEAATAAKINPSQLSKADLSDGLDSFSQLVRSVEQAVDIVDILPKFKEMPKDKVDFTIWCYVNYIRDLKGLPLVEHKEIYEFYEERKKEYAAMSDGDDDGII